MKENTSHSERTTVTQPERAAGIERRAHLKCMHGAENDNDEPRDTIFLFTTQKST